MAKGQTSQPVRIYVWSGWREHPAIRELVDRGHVLVDAVMADAGADLILHPAAHGWHEVLFAEAHRKDGTPYRPFLDAAVKAGRQRRRETK